MASGRPCARGEFGIDGRRCLYVEHEPLTDMGWQAWDVITRCAGQLRLAPNAAVIGIDMAAALAMGAALDHDVCALAELLPSAEAGMVKAMNERLSAPPT